MTPKLAVAAAIFDPDLRNAAPAARQAGFTGLQIAPFSPALDLTTLSTTGKKDLLNLLRNNQLQLVGLNIDLGPKGFASGADIDAILDRLDSVLLSAAGLSSPLVCIDLGPLPSPAKEEKPKPKIDPLQSGLIIIPTPAPISAPPPTSQPVDLPFMAIIDSALAELARRADRHGVSIAFRSELADFAALDRLLRVAACPWFGIDLEPISLLRDDWSQDEIFSNLGTQIRHVRGRDAILGSGGRTKPTLIGRGSVDWATLLRNLDDVGYKSWITLDPYDLPDRPAAARAGAAFLKTVSP